MISSLACIGPGRLGPALARRWQEAGIALLGFLGRDSQRSADAIRFCAAGRVLSAYRDLGAADAVLLSVSDAALPEVVAAAVASDAPRPGSLWFHCSGYVGVDVLQPLAELGAGIGSLHPLCPVADREAGYRALPGKPALLEAGPKSIRILEDMARRAELDPIIAPLGVNRPLYHAACSMAANGLTALHDLLAELLGQASGLPRAKVEPMLTSLMHGALGACGEVGASAALSGPIARGDCAIIAGHLAALESSQAGDSYRALMRRAVALAQRQGGVDEQRVAELLALLQDPSMEDRG